MARWDYPHGTNGTCVPGCKMFGLCHCNCGGVTNRATQARPSDNEYVGDPRVFLPHHFYPSQWRERRMATCHPDRPSHAHGWCKECYWSKYKRANRRRDRRAVNDWERARFTAYMSLVRSGLDARSALIQLEREVPSELEAADV
jgi:hypothetical protein